MNGIFTIILVILEVFTSTLDAKPRKFQNVFDYRELRMRIPDEGNDSFRRNYRLALSGDASAQNEVGIDYYNREDEVSQNYKKARYWFRKAAVNGNTLTQANYGELLYFGRGVDQDYAEAFRWYLKAAKRRIPWRCPRPENCMLRVGV